MKNIKLMKKYILYILLVVPFLFFSCNKDTVDLLEENLGGPRVHQTDFISGDEATRSSFEFDGSKLVFGWEAKDNVGIFTTAAKPYAPVTRADGSSFDGESASSSAGESSNGSNTVGNDGNNSVDSDNDKSEVVETTDGLIIPDNNNPETIHPEYSNTGLYLTDPEKSNQVKYGCIGIKAGAQSAVIYSSDGGFAWDENSRWTAYYPLKTTSEKYNKIEFDFSGQKQVGFVNMTAYYNKNMSTYRASERIACKHISDADIMISPETGLNNGGMLFEMRHVGAIARFFLVFPKDKAYKLVKLQLICESKIFYTKGQYNLKSRPYKAYASDGDYGLTLVGANKTNSQVQPLGDATNMLELEFEPEKVKIDTEASDGDCLIAYLMMYPVTYKQSQHGNLYAYVTAIDPITNEEIHFITEPLANKDMVSGRYYQWTTYADPQDGLYPIELTATLLPWQDIVGSGIETDLEK